MMNETEKQLSSLRVSLNWISVWLFVIAFCSFMNMCGSQTVHVTNTVKTHEVSE